MAACKGVIYITCGCLSGCITLTVAACKGVIYTKCGCLLGLIILNLAVCLGHNISTVAACKDLL